MLLLHIFLYNIICDVLLYVCCWSCKIGLIIGDRLMNDICSAPTEHLL